MNYKGQKTKCCKVLEEVEKEIIDLKNGRGDTAFEIGCEFATPRYYRNEGYYSAIHDIQQIISKLKQ